MAKSKKPAVDQQILDLINDVKRRKAEISRAERPDWKTACAFSYDDKSGRAGDVVNLHVETNVRTLILIGAFLRERARAYGEAAKELGVEAPPEFTWGGSPVGDWMSDLRTRIDKIEIQAKRKKLEALETRLNAIVSPDLRAKLELEAISAELQ